MFKQKRYLPMAGTLSAADPVDEHTFTLEDHVNMHGLVARLFFTCETDGDIMMVNWALMCVPEGVSSASLLSADLDSDKGTEQLWIVSAAMAMANQVTSVEIAPATSRSCPKDSLIGFKFRRDTVIVGSGTVKYCGFATWWETQL